MSAITLNAFPPLHAFNSPRSWFLAVIVLVHLGFFWALTSGLTVYVWPPNPPGEMFIVPEELPPPAPVDPIIKEIRPDFGKPYVPVVTTPTLQTEVEPVGPIIVSRDPVPTITEGEESGRGPVIVEPMIDPRIGLSEPVYPVSEIRQLHEGTVWLSVEILPTGRVGQVRIDQSSGYPKLDESAAREARRWRMKPGMQDGIATAMWKRVPITFRLKN